MSITFLTNMKNCSYVVQVPFSPTFNKSFMLNSSTFKDLLKNSGDTLEDAICHSGSLNTLNATVTWILVFS